MNPQHQHEHQEPQEHGDACCPPFLPECELLYDDGPDHTVLFNECIKNPGHTNFIPVNDFEKSHLPREWQTEEIRSFIQLMIDRTVKVSVWYTSPDRPSTYRNSKAPYPYWDLRGEKRVVRAATGFIRYVIDSSNKGKPCPCHLCKESDAPAMRYWEVVVITATHVVFDTKEAANSKFECFYHTADKKGVKCLYGVSCNDDDAFINEFGDRCQVTCVTHDPDLIKTLQDLQMKYRGKYNSLSNISYGVMISHPHGGIKRVSIGKIRHATIPITPVFSTGETHPFGKDAKCRRPLLPQPLISTSSGGPSQRTRKRKRYEMTACGKPDTDPMYINDAGTDLGDSSMPNFDPKVPMEHGQEYLLPQGMTFTPLHAHSFCVVRKYGKEFWILFPKDTRINLPNGEEILFPPDTEFYCEKTNFYMTYQSMYYMTYDIPTCPGSSGSEVIHYDDMFTRSFLNHTGALPCGASRSSLNICLR